MIKIELEHKFIETNGINLHVTFSGPSDGEPVIFLHGFPESWFGWENQIAFLANKGFRVIVPDQRGYNLSDKPKGKKNYHMEIIVQDLLGLADNLNLNLKSFNLVGHDFGAMVSWWTAIYYPERIKKLVISNVPHPKVMRDFVKRNFAQIRKSWYAFFFRIPKLPEIFVRARNWKFLTSALAEGLSEEQLNRYREAWGQPNAITSMINWYRMFGKKFSTKTDSFTVKVPTKILWGKQDPHISYRMAELSVSMCEKCELITFDEASHWVQHDEPEEFNKQLLKFLED